MKDPVLVRHILSEQRSGKGGKRDEGKVTELGQI